MTLDLSFEPAVTRTGLSHGDGLRAYQLNWRREAERDARTRRYWPHVALTTALALASLIAAGI